MIRRIVLAAGVAGALCAAPVQAAYVINFVETDGNVVATGGGSLDVSALMGPFPTTGIVGVNPNFPSVLIGPTPSGSVDIYNGGAGPISWGSGIFTAADSGSSNLIGASYDPSVGPMVVPAGYISGSDLGTSTAIQTGATFASLGLDPGTYVSIWAADSFTVNVIARPAVPDPATWALLLLGFGAIGHALRRRPVRARLTV